MWETSEIKERGRAAFRLNYWKCVLVSFIMGFVVSGPSSVTSRISVNNENSQQAFQNLADAYNNLSSGEQFAVIAATSGVITLAVVIGLLVKIFLYNPLKVGGLSFFKMNVIDPPADLNDIGAGFKNYLHIFVTLFLNDLFLALWFCLLIVPGFIKSYSYRMVPYILADEPDLSPTETITRSREMMDGNKWHAFCYDLSFIGWWLLTFLTCGLVGLFWFGPYKNNSDAALYLAIRGEMQPDYDENVPPVYPVEPMQPADNVPPVYPVEPMQPAEAEPVPHVEAEVVQPAETEPVQHVEAEVVQPTETEPVQHVEAEVVQPAVVEEAPQQAAEATMQTVAEEAPQQTAGVEKAPQTVEEAPQDESEEAQQKDNE